MIRRATPDDLDAIVAVHVAGFRAGNVPHLPHERARRFYEREGWALDGGRRDHLGAMAVRFRVTL